MEPYRSPNKPSVSKVKVINGSTPSTRSSRHGDIASNDSRHKGGKHHLWNMNTNQSNGFDPSSSSTTLPSHSSSLSSFGFASGSTASSVISSGYNHRHEFGGKPAFAAPMVQYRPSNHRNVDYEEAMDIDTQEDLDIPTANQTRVLQNYNESSPARWKVLNTSKLNLVTPKEGKETVSSTSTNSASSRPVVPKANKGPAKKKAIYIVLHVSDVVIGSLHAKATAPVKIYAERVFLEIEFKDSSVLSLKLSCKDFSHCTVSFEAPKPVIIFTLTSEAIKVILDKKKGPILDPNKQDGVMNKLVLHLNYSKNGLPKTVKEELIELFQNRMCNDIQWSELSSSEIQKLLHPEEKAAEHVIKNEASSCENSESEQQSSVDTPVAARKILTPKKTRSVLKKPLFEETVVASSSQTVADETSKAKNDATSEVLSDKIVTRSRRRKAEAEAEEPHSPPKITPGKDGVNTSTTSTIDDQTKDDKKADDKGDQATVPQDRDLLQHHSRMESHISLLGKHSEEQRHTLEHHQKLLTLERAQRSRSFERIQELQITNRDTQLCLIQQNETIALLESETDRLNVTIRQLQQELTQERESSTMMRKVQTDLVQARRELDEEKVVRGLRDQQLQERQAELAEMRRLYTEESSSKRRVEEELQRTQNSSLQHMDELENLRLFRQTQEHELQGREERLQASEQRYQDERNARANLEDQLRLLRIENDELRCSRETAQYELSQEREHRRDESEAFSQERQSYDQRIRESSNSLAECERRLQELRTTVNNSQSLLDDHRRIEPRDWIIRREEVTTSDVSLGTGAWGSVKVGTFRSCRIAVKQIHELILSPHNRRLFEREMSIASRCRHPCLLQFIGATNDDGIPLFLTELLDTDLRAVLSCRSLHQEEIITIALDVARALNYLHLSKPFPIIHRDISSSNVLLWKRDTCWRAKLSDYGAANFMRQYMTVNPGANIYAAPEASTSQQSPKVDIYSFGLLLCELCIRELPVPQQTQEQIALVTNGMLRELIIRCVRIDPDDRPTMADVITLLVQQQQHLLEHGVVSVNGRSAAL